MPQKPASKSAKPAKSPVRTINTAFGTKPDPRPRKKEEERRRAKRAAGKRVKGRGVKKTLREWRITRQITQEELGVRAKVGYNTISYHENGRRETSDMVRARLAAVLEVEVDDVDWDVIRE